MAKAERVRAPALERSPSHLLHGALQLALDVYNEEMGAGAITQRQFAVLAAVSEREGLTQTELVDATGIDRSTLADMIARMIKKAYLARERSEADARANTVRLTDEGRAVLGAAAPRVQAADVRILAALAAGKRDGFVNQLRALAHAGDFAPEPEAAVEAERPTKRKKADGGAKSADAKGKAGKGKGKKKKARRARAAAAEPGPEPTP